MTVPTRHRAPPRASRVAPEHESPTNSGARSVGAGGTGPVVPDRLLKVEEAAAMLGLKPATLYQWAYQRRIPVVKLFGPRGALRFRESDLRALIAGSVRPARRERGGGGLDL